LFGRIYGSSLGSLGAMVVSPSAALCRKECFV
jgi:hypothetical protein